MNIRKNIDYSDMFTAMDAAVDVGLSQMKLYCELGRLVCERAEKGAAVAAAEYLHSRFPDVSGFSPRNLRRMREFYRMYAGNGIHVGRNGMACCPFHNDKIPSMKLDRRYHCFGCGADGDVIDFAAALYGLGKKEAAVQLAQDFGLSYEDWKPPGKAKKPKPRQKSPEEQFQEAKNRCFRILTDYLHLLMAWRTDYAPHSPEEAFHPRFVEALQKQAQVEYLLDVLLFGETEEKADLITDYGKDVIQLEQRMAELAAADAARTKKHYERHAAAPEH